MNQPAVNLDFLLNDFVLRCAPHVQHAIGEGLRRLVAEACDHLARLEIDARMESLNVSVAAGIALYLLARR